MTDDKRERPEDVFTPAAPVRDDMYAARVEGGLETQVESALAQPGRQLVVYGDTGVGKTSLIEYLSRRFNYRYHRVEFGPALDEILRGTLADLGHADELERVDRESRTYGGKIAVPMVAEGGGEAQDTTEVRTAALPRDLVRRTIEALEDAGDPGLLPRQLRERPHVARRQRHATPGREPPQDARRPSTRRGVSPEGSDRWDTGASEELIRLDQATSRRTEQIELGRILWR